MCRNEIIITMERERVLSWPELCLTGSWPALPLATLQENTCCQCYFQTRKTQLASFHSNCESTKTPRILRFFAFYTESTKLHFTRSNVLSNYYGFYDISHQSMVDYFIS